MPRALRVLLVDDKPHLRALVRTLVDDLGHEVLGEAKNGADAVAKAEDLRPDVVIMDWDMPVMKGLEATALIKKVQPEVQVIAYSSAVDPLLRDLFLRSGARELVSKGDVAGLMAQLDACAASY